MPLAFTDVYGVDGVITEDLVVKTDSEHREEIDTSVRTVTNRTEAESTESVLGDVYSNLIVDLPHETPIREIERVEPTEG